MATLKGQNLRIGIEGANSEFYVVAMSTGCVVTLTNNTESGTHKDVLGLADQPIVVSKSWTLQADSLNVVDAGALLTAIKNMQPLAVMFDETSTTNNYASQHATFARKGSAYFNDLTFNFNDRENSTKNIQMTGTGELSTVATGDVYMGPSSDAYTKGQFVRLFLSSDNTAAPAAVIGAARQLSLHVSVTLENATTKDTEGDWQVMEPTAISYDISTTALVRGNDTITSQVGAKGLADLETIYQNGTPVKWKIANTSGANNRTASSTIVSGSVIIQTLTINGPNRQDATYTAQLAGYGNYDVAA
jgi:predicted secreted protein